MTLPHVEFQQYGDRPEYRVFGSAEDDTKFRIRIRYGKALNVVGEGFSKEVVGDVGDRVSVVVEVFPKKSESIEFFAENAGVPIPKDKQTEALRTTGWPTTLPKQELYDPTWIEKNQVSSIEDDVLTRVEAFTGKDVSSEVIKKVMDYIGEMITPEKLAEAKANAEKGMSGRE